MHNPVKARKRKIVWIVIKEIIFMSCGVLCCTLPSPWRFLVLIVLGAREIVRDAWRETHKPTELSSEMPELPEPPELPRKIKKPADKLELVKPEKEKRTKKQ